MKQALEKIDFFTGLDRKLLDKIAAAALMRNYPEGEVIVRQGESGLGLYVILKGKVRVEREHGGVARVLAELGPQQFFAEIAMVDSKPRSATITTITDTECMLLTRDSFRKLVETHPELALRLARVLAERLRIANDKLASAETAQVVPPPPGAAPAVPANGTATAAGKTAAESDASTKSKVQASMLDTFQKLYSLKALVRFSVAVLGCPVEGSAANIIEQIRVGETKAILLPADEPVALDILASEHGSFSVHLFSPGSETPLGFGPLPITPTDQFQLRVDLDNGAIGLHNVDQVFPASH
jgi:CRP-like cAMP-binding protein